MSTDESPDSTVTPHEADEFIKEEEEEKPVKPADLSDDEDLVSMTVHVKLFNYIVASAEQFLI